MLKGEKCKIFHLRFFNQKYSPKTLTHTYPNLFLNRIQIHGEFFLLKSDTPLHEAAGSHPLHDAAGSHPLHHAARSHPLHFAAGSQVNDFCRNLPATSCSEESNLPTAFCSGRMFLPAASCSGQSDLSAAKWSGESNLTATSCSRESNLTGAKCSEELKWEISGNISPRRRGRVQSYRRTMQWGVKSKNFGRLPRPLKGQSCHKSRMGDLNYPIPKRITYILNLSVYNVFLTPLHDAAGPGGKL